MSFLATSAFENAIRNPENPAHMMVIKPVPRRIRIYCGDTLLADSTNAIRIMEIGKSVYDPVVYVPEADLQVSFGPIEKSTFCPIKGHARYVAIDGDEIGWTYAEPLDMAEQLSGFYAFWPARTRQVEGD